MKWDVRRLTAELKELFYTEQKKQTSSLGLLWFSRDILQVLNFCLSSSVLSFTFFFFWFSFICFDLGSKFGRQTQKRKMREFCSILSYDIRKITIIILVLHYSFVSSSVFTHENEMDVSHFIFTQHMNRIFLFFFFFLPFLEREEPERCLSGMSGSSLPQRHYCLGERTSVAFQKVVYECGVSACAKLKKCRYLGLWFHFWSFWKVFLFFITGVFTVQIVFTKNQMDTILFFKYKMFVTCKEKDGCLREEEEEDNTID